ncbi:alkaline phosphatase PhoX [Acrocarpospora catenulata]|uniref:alkaline phosphatase PhoX n=1 Tax=Acrocarpospora catenulata TaxID=2836182 RepID=UPI001BDA082E|nr:alkaline phosphatase PhoX [Acrocarpospora catenulata]
MLRRTFVRSGALAALTGSLWRSACSAPAPASGPRPTPATSTTTSALGPVGYGELQTPDVNSIRLAKGFTSRVVGRSGERVGGLTWHPAPDGGACFADGDGWIYVSNSEVPVIGGVSALRFGPDGTIKTGYRILSGTDRNCAGGATPWNTWLSCEETARGRVFECDPYGYRAAAPRLAMGRFKHEAAACDPDREVVYLTEDEPTGCFYRFRPQDWGDLTTGVLEVMVGDGPGPVRWRRVPNPAATDEPTRDQVEGALRFNGGEGCYYSGGFCYFTTKGDNRVWAYDADNRRLSVLYDADAPLNGVDNVYVSRSGDLFVAEDGGNMEINIITADGIVSPFLRLVGHGKSEITGLAFSPEGDRLYFSSQRGTTGSNRSGVTYEVTGPFRT